MPSNYFSPKLLWRDLHQSYFIVALYLGIISGTILALVFHINYFASPIWLIFACLLLTVAFIRPKTAFFIIAILAGMLIAFFRSATELYDTAYIRTFYDQTITVTGTIDGDPESDEDTTTKIKLTNLKFGEDASHPATGSLYVSLSYQPNLARSDEVTLRGKLLNGLGTYSGYLYQPKIIAIRHPDPGDLILAARNWFANRIKSQLPAPEVNLGLSYLLGMKSNLDENLSEKLRNVGLVHIVVASGAHLSILVEIARKIFGRLSRFSGLLFSILFTLIFMALVGWTPSILRAGLMVILTLLAWYTGRQFAPWRLILLVAAFTLILNPMFIINLGWLLSFASYAGIMILGPHLTKFFYGHKSPKFIASTILTTISATLMTLPIILYYYGQISLISIFANLLILPTLPYAMGLTFLTGLTTDIPLLSTALSFLAEKLLTFHISIVNFFGQMPEFLIRIGPYNPWVFTLYFFILTPLAILLLRQKMLKLNKSNINRSKLCLDTVNGPLPSAKKPS